MKDGEQGALEDGVWFGEGVTVGRAAGWAELPPGKGTARRWGAASASRPAPGARPTPVRPSGGTQHSDVGTSGTAAHSLKAPPALSLHLTKLHIFTCTDPEVVVPLSPGFSHLYVRYAQGIPRCPPEAAASAG